MLLGLRYRAAALIAMSALVVIVGTAAAIFAGWSFGMAVLAALGAACLLQRGDAIQVEWFSGASRFLCPIQYCD